MRVGNVVTVAGQIDVTLTASGTPSEVGISLPLASTLGTAYKLGGTMNGIAVSTLWGVQGDATNNRAQCKTAGSTSTASQTYTYQFTYEVV